MFEWGGEKHKPLPISTSKWITLTTKEVSWKKAKEICNDNEGRLPTIKELKKVVTDCSGISYTYLKGDFKKHRSKNLANKFYKSCYKEKGFTSDVYWSSSSVTGDNSRAWFVFFEYGFGNWDVKTSKNNVRCLKK